MNRIEDEEEDENDDGRAPKEEWRERRGSNP
jgi:hypothetical protein